MMSKKAPNMHQDQRKPEKGLSVATRKNKVSFRCPISGLLCVIEDPTKLQLQLINQHKLTAMQLMR